MKNLTVTLVSIMVSLLLARYYPYTSRKLIFEYITAAYLSSGSGKFINNDAANLFHT